MGGRRAEFDPRNPGDPAYYEAEANDQIERANLALQMQRSGAEKTLAALKVREHALQNPLIGQAVERAERKAAKKGRKPTMNDFTKALRKLEAKHGSGQIVAKGALGGIVPRVIDMRPGRFG
jgi:nucleoid-associated protein YgaU